YRVAGGIGINHRPADTGQDIGDVLGILRHLLIGHIELRAIDRVGAGIADAPGRHVLQLPLYTRIDHDGLAIGIACNAIRRTAVILVLDILAEGHDAGVTADGAGNIALITT